MIWVQLVRHFQVGIWDRHVSHERMPLKVQTPDLNLQALETVGSDFLAPEPLSRQRRSYLQPLVVALMA